MVEETEKLAASEEAENSSMANNVGGEESEVEEGEIVGGDSDDAAKAMAPPPPRHPLENSWTFWFDNPSAKSKQAAWGSSIRPIYTFSSVEDFWGYVTMWICILWVVDLCQLSFCSLLAMIGEQFDYGDEICGAVVSVRGKQEKIALWTKNAANEAAQLSIGRQWKEFLDYNDTIGFIFHDDAKRLDRAAKNRYTV
ncbi:UNVERIFIED_CONTAM: Eukaryotic translation initiation factor 4E-1 [Sesamum calycinum]|uniref:eIF-4F 25 kDa subunit n=1 Tax=Sesamum calycinum TaxID=2727403 RepID=A0AAW2Q714_9LAMI